MNEEVEHGKINTYHWVSMSDNLSWIQFSILLISSGDYHCVYYFL